MTRRRSPKPPIQYKRMDDAELVTLAQKELPYGMRAYEELVRRHEAVLYAVCVRLLGTKEDAEDISQDVMLKVFSGIKNFKGKSSFKTWLLRIANNACIDRLKKKAVADRYNETLRNESLAYSEPNDDEDHVLQLLRQVSEDERQVLVLRFVADLSLQEVADSLNLSLSATKMRLYRAKEKLRALANRTATL